MCSWNLFAQQIGVPSDQITLIKATTPQSGPTYFYLCFIQALEWWEANHDNPVYEIMIDALDPGIGKVTPVMNTALASELREFMAEQQGESSTVTIIGHWPLNFCTLHITELWILFTVDSIPSLSVFSHHDLEQLDAPMQRGSLENTWLYTTEIDNWLFWHHSLILLWGNFQQISASLKSPKTFPLYTRFEITLHGSGVIFTTSSFYMVVKIATMHTEWSCWMWEWRLVLNCKEWFHEFCIIL